MSMARACSMQDLMISTANLLRSDDYPYSYAEVLAGLLEDAARELAEDYVRLPDFESPSTSAYAVRLLEKLQVGRVVTDVGVVIDPEDGSAVLRLVFDEKPPKGTLEATEADAAVEVACHG